MSLVTGHRGAAAAVTAAVLLGGACAAGCTGMTPANELAHPVAGGTATIGHPVTGGQAVIDSFTARLRRGAATPYEAQYFTAGRASRRIVYAVRPPGELLFRDTALVSGKGREIVLNGSGEYLCRSPGHARWACERLGKAGAAAHRPRPSASTPRRTGRRSFTPSRARPASAGTTSARSRR